MSENINKDVELSEEELRQAAGGRRTRQSDDLASGPIVLHPGKGHGGQIRQNDGELDGQVDVQL